jgi:hypothetical protein
MCDKSAYRKVEKVFDRGDFLENAHKDMLYNQDVIAKRFRNRAAQRSCAKLHSILKQNKKKK